MQSSNPGWHVLGAVLASVLFPSIGHAEIYKWVDAKGQTHYTERKADAGDAKTVEVKPPPPPAPQTSTPSQQDWGAWSRSTSSSRSPSKESYGPYGPPVGRTKPLSDGRDHGTDASRCALARDVLSGAVQHRNGKPTDQYDREVAQNDTKAFCK